MTDFQALYDFIDRAVKNRKYAENTGFGLKAALKLFEAHINSDERSSIEKFKENLDQIYHSVSMKNKDVAASSLATYKYRVGKVLKDYEMYGVDPTKMVNWTIKQPVGRSMQKKPSSVLAKNKNNDEPKQTFDLETRDSFVFVFRGGIKLLIPRTQASSDAVADGELKMSRQEIAKFADKFMEAQANSKEEVQADTEELE